MLEQVLCHLRWDNGGEGFTDLCFDRGRLLLGQWQAVYLWEQCSSDKGM